MINPLWYTSLFDAYTSHLYAQFWSQGCDMEFDIYMRRNKTFWILLTTLVGHMSMLLTEGNIPSYGAKSAGYRQVQVKST